MSKTLLDRATANRFFGVNYLTCTRKDFNEIVLNKLVDLSFRSLIFLRQSLKKSPETKWRIHKLRYIVIFIKEKETKPKSKGRAYTERKERLDDYIEDEDYQKDIIDMKQDLEFERRNR